MPLYNAWPYEYGKTLAVRQTHNTSKTLVVRQTHNTSTNKRKKKLIRNKRTDSLSSKKPEVVTQAESDKTVVIVVSSNTDNKTNETNHKETKNKEAKAESEKTYTSVVSANTDNETKETNRKETKNKEAKAESDKTVTSVVSANTDNETKETNRKETKNKEAKAESDKTVSSVVSANTDNETKETNRKETKNKEAKAESDKAVTSIVSTSHNVNHSQLSIENKDIVRNEPISRKRKATNIDSEQDDVLENISKKTRINIDLEKYKGLENISKKSTTSGDSEQDDVLKGVSKKPRTNTASEQDDFHELVSKKPRKYYVDIPSSVIRKTVLKEEITDQTNASQEINVVNVNNLTDNNNIISKETSKTSSVKRQIEGSCLGQTSVRGASILSTTVLNKETNFETVPNVKRADIEGVNGDDKRLSTQFNMTEQNTEGPTRLIKEQTKASRPYE